MHMSANTLRMRRCSAVAVVMCCSILAVSVGAGITGLTGAVQAQNDTPTQNESSNTTAERPVPTNWNNSTGTPPDVPDPGFWYGDDNGSSRTSGDNGSGEPQRNESATQGCSLIHFSTWGCYASVVSVIINDVTDGVSVLVNRFHEETLTLPAPGSVDNPTSWLNPQNGYWPAVMRIYQALYAVVAIPMLAQGTWNIFAADPHERRSEARHWGKNIALLVGGLLIVPLALHAGNIIAMGFAPSGDEFMHTPSNVARLGIGLTVGAALLATKAVLVVLAVIILWIQDLLTYFSVAMYPAAIWLLSSRNTFAQALGAGIMGMLVFLIFLKAAQAVFLRFLFELPLGFSAGALSVETVLLTIIGVALAFLAMPYYGTKKAIPAAMVTITGKVRDTSEDWIEDTREKFPDREQLVERVHGGGGQTADRASPGGGSATATADATVATRRVGSLQQQTTSYSQRGGGHRMGANSAADASATERSQDLGDTGAVDSADTTQDTDHDTDR